MFTFYLSLFSLWAISIEPKVFLVVIDGVRNLEVSGNAKDSQGNIIPKESLFPNLTAMKEKGLFFENIRISNPAGISLPAYADIFSGKRQGKIINNEPKIIQSQFPTIFQILEKNKIKVALFSSWEHLCPLSIYPRFKSPSFFKSCGWRKEKNYFKPEIFKGSRSDSDTFLELLKIIPSIKPRFVFIHFGDADEEAHLHDTVKKQKGIEYGIFHYHKALKESDQYIGRLWSYLNDDPSYKDQTYLFVTTDHGRDDIPNPEQFWDHGECLKYQKALCSGCQRSFLFALGPGIERKNVTSSYSHVDLAPTITSLFDVKMEGTEGSPIKELGRHSDIE